MCFSRKDCEKDVENFKQKETEIRLHHQSEQAVVAVKRFAERGTMFGDKADFEIIAKKKTERVQRSVSFYRVIFRVRR